MKNILIFFLIFFSYSLSVFAKTIEQKKSEIKKVYEAGGMSKVEFNKAITHVSNLVGAKESGYRALTNLGSDGGQEVPHLHFHIFAGEKIGKMVN